MGRVLPGVAVDVGTTTVVLHVVDIKTGKKLATVSRANDQIRYGADVTSRIEYSIAREHSTLTLLIRRQIGSMLAEACSIAKINPGRISKIVIVGNTIMQHLVEDFSPVSMGLSPYTPHCLFGQSFRAWAELNVSSRASIYYTPAVSAFVGGDITAGLLAAGFEKFDHSTLFLDIGTNGEIVLKHNGTYYCCATAAGPAFEGAEIELGMVAEKGAISRVRLSGDRRVLGYNVIGSGEPKGFCGSGLIDLLACLLEKGEIDETGRLLSGDRFYISPGNDSIYLSAKDVRKLQLAKAAIAAGIDVLLLYAGIDEADVSSLALAGGIGNYLDTANAAGIGLFDRALLPVSYPVGNAAGEGAVLALTEKDAEERLENIRDKCEYIDLSANAFFNERFVERMGF